MKKIKIGTANDETSLWHARQTERQLARIGIAAELVMLPGKGDHFQPLSDKGGSPQASPLAAALLCGEVDMVALDLKSLPTTQPEGLVLAGVSQRDTPGEWLLIHPESVAEGLVFSLKANAVTGVDTAVRLTQMLEFRPDLSIVTAFPLKVGEQVERLRQGDLDALVVCGTDMERLGFDLSGLKVVKCSPREFVPAPAQGVMAYQCCEADLETRRLLKHLHHPLVAAVTNVERGIKKNLGDHLPLGAYCELDANGHYHVWAAFSPAEDAPLKRVRLSSSTHLSLAERVVNG